MAKVLGEKKDNIFFCIVVSKEVSNMVDFEGVMVLILVSLMGRWLCGTGSVSNSTESGEVFFVF